MCNIKEVSVCIVECCILKHNIQTLIIVLINQVINSTFLLKFSTRIDKYLKLILNSNTVFA